MGVAVLPSQDFHQNHHQMVFPANKIRRNPIPHPQPNRSNRRRRSSPPPKSPGNLTRPVSPPVTEHVRILKRGEDLSQARRPEVVAIADGFFAGSTVSSSPPPSSVPLPAFFTGRRNCGHNQVIESELKRVLRLI